MCIGARLVEGAFTIFTRATGSLVETMFVGLELNCVNIHTPIVTCYEHDGYVTPPRRTALIYGSVGHYRARHDGQGYQEQRHLSMAEACWATGVSTSSDYVRVMDQRLCQWLLCQANSYPVR